MKMSISRAFAYLMYFRNLNKKLSSKALSFFGDCLFMCRIVQCFKCSISNRNKFSMRHQSVSPTHRRFDESSNMSEQNKKNTCAPPGSFHTTKRFYITRRLYGINHLIKSINQLINSIHLLIHSITQRIHGLPRLINGWGALPPAIN